jgi:hypothetical protein
MNTKRNCITALYSFFLLSFFVLNGSEGYAQSAKTTREQKTATKKQDIKKMMDSQNFVFMAQMAMPQGWSTIQLNYNYNVTISRDSVDCYLPYYGRAYVAPLNPTDPTQTGIQFKSKKFDYKNGNKKSGWEVTIVPHDVKETRQMILTVSDLGYANLNVISNNRQPISFNGYITENKPKDKKSS